VWSGHAGQQPTIEISAREQPLAGHFGAGDLPFGHQLMELPLLQAQIVGRLRGRQQLQACTELHIIA
jgi:hypothetical protein